jgi:hypothetical protein
MKIFKLGNHPVLSLTPTSALDVLRAFQNEQGKSLAGQIGLEVIDDQTFYITVYNDALADAFERFLQTPRMAIPFTLVDRVPTPGEVHQEAQEPVQAMAETLVPSWDETVWGVVYVRARMTSMDAGRIAQQIAAEYPTVEVWCNVTLPDGEGWIWVGFSNNHVCGWFTERAASAGLKVDKESCDCLPGGRKGEMRLIQPPAPLINMMPPRQPEPVAQPAGGGRMSGWASRAKGRFPGRPR